MSKITREDCRYISIYKLKEWGSLDSNYYIGSVVWKNDDGEIKNSVNYVLNLQKRNFNLHYKIRSWDSNKWHNINHDYPLVPTPCNYGGFRWWFVCSAYRNGVYCGRRVAKLYFGDGSHYFACRHCYDLSYDSRNKNRKGNYAFLSRYFDISKDIENLQEQIKIPIRAGKPTKKYTRLLKKERILGIVSKYALGEFDKK